MPTRLETLAKNRLPLEILLLVFICSCPDVSAQNQTISRDFPRTKSQVQTVAFDDQDFDGKKLAELKEIAVKKLEKSKYRSTQTTERFDDKDSPYNFSIKSVTEFVPPNSEHNIQESESPGKKSHYEKYSIGNKIYVRQDDGSWKMSVSDGKANSVAIGGGGGKGMGDRSGSARQSKPPITYNSIKGQTINGRKADLYTATESFARKTNGGEESSVETDSYWFDKDGFIIKTEFSSVYKNKNFSTSFRIITDYEYDQNIKISPPNTKK